MADAISNLPDETWKPVVGFEGLYEVSDRGRVRGLDRLVRTKGGSLRPQSGQLRALVPSSKPPFYSTVMLYRRNTGSCAQVHRLVLEAFVGPCPRGCECCHYDGNAQNNRIENLRWDTKSANGSDRKRHGTAGGHRSRRARLHTSST